MILVGRFTLNRETGALLRRAGVRVEAITASGTWPDPSHAIARAHPWSSLTDGSLAGQDQVWAQHWDRAGAAVVAAVGPLLEESWPSGPAVAGTVLDALNDDDLLVLGSSNTARDVDRAGVSGRSLLITGNRGLAGIDGTNSAAVGVALAAPEQRVTAVIGDLTFLHDVNGLLIGPGEPHPDLTIVVVNDDGGGIFTTLEYGEPRRTADSGSATFERVFGTPTGADLQGVVSAYGAVAERVRTPEGLREALGRRTTGIRVLEVPVPRAGHRDLGTTLRRAAAEALAALS